MIWIDAHGDLNTPETSPSGNVHGMPLGGALGRAPDWFSHDGLALPALDPSRVALVGIRSLDAGERALLRESDIRVFTMSDIDRIGIERAMREALDRVSGPGFVHVSFDLDSLDPEVAPGVGTPVRGGLTYREAHLACELIAESGIVGSLEVVEANPILDRENTTALTAVELDRERAREDDSLSHSARSRAGLFTPEDLCLPAAEAAPSPLGATGGTLGMAPQPERATTTRATPGAETEPSSRMNSCRRLSERFRSCTLDRREALREHRQHP